MTTTTMLFVDDETRILDGLRRLLHGKRQDWKLHFANSGEAALAQLAADDIDVIVSDMRMPGMDGAKLLDIVKQRYPHTVRVVLSGQAEVTTVMQAFGVTHQVLSKPCNFTSLESAIKRAMNLRPLLGSEVIQKLVSGTTNLPSMPAVYQELVTCLRSADASLQQAADIIARDVGMTTGILKVVNSAYFGLGTVVTDIRRATTILGLDVIMALVLEHAIFDAGDVLPHGYLDFEQLRRHSLRTAAVARELADQELATAGQGDTAFLAGVVHDIGQLVLFRAMPQRYQLVGDRMRESGCSRHEAEQSIFQTSHAEIGAYLLALWGFDNILVEAVAFHESPEKLSTTEFGLPGLLNVADNLAAHPDIEDVTDPRLGPSLEPYLRGLGLNDRWNDWRHICNEPGTDGAVS